MLYTIIRFQGQPEDRFGPTATFVMAAPALLDGNAVIITLTAIHAMKTLAGPALVLHRGEKAVRAIRRK
jgi:hypothetical protein